MQEELVVGFNPVPAAERVAHFHGLVRSRLIWFGVAILICVAVYLWQRKDLDPLSVAALFGVGLGFSLVWLVIAIVGLLIARRALDGVDQGEAVRVDRSGITVRGTHAPWSDIESVGTVRGGIGVGPCLAVRSRSGTQSVPLSYLDIMPGSLDSAIRAYSAGQRWLDTSGLGI